MTYVEELQASYKAARNRLGWAGVKLTPLSYRNEPSPEPLPAVAEIVSEPIVLVEEQLPASPLPPRLCIRAIIDITADHFGWKARDLLSIRRNMPISRARQVAMYLSRQFLVVSFPVIAKVFKRDYTTVLHGFRNTAERRQFDSELNSHVLEIERTIRERFPQ